jgi:hypothetical protein
VVPPLAGNLQVPPRESFSTKSEGGHDPRPDRIKHAGKDDWDGGGCCLRGQRRAGRTNDQDIQLLSEDIGNELGEALLVPFGKSGFDDDVLAFDVPRGPEALEEAYPTRGTLVACWA